MRAVCTVLATIVTMLTCAAATADTKSTPPDQVLNDLRYFVGDWTLTGAIGDQAIKGSAKIDFVPGEKCLLGTVSYKQGEGDSSFSFVSGWDSTTGGFTENGVTSDGAIYTLRWIRKDATTIKGKDTGTANGKAIVGDYTLEQKDKDNFSVRGIFKVGSETQDWKFRYTKAK